MQVKYGVHNRKSCRQIETVIRWWNSTACPRDRAHSATGTKLYRIIINGIVSAYIKRKRNTRMKSRKARRSMLRDNQRFDVRAARCLREIIIELPAHWPACLPLSLPVFTLGDSLVDSKRLNGRFRSGPSYDHLAVSGSPLVELRPREFVVALLRELRPLMRGLGSRAAVRRQTINSCVRI